MDKWKNKNLKDIFDNIPIGELSYWVATERNMKVSLNYGTAGDINSAVVFKVDSDDEFVQYCFLNDESFISSQLKSFILNKKELPDFVKTAQDLAIWVAILFVLKK